MSIGERLRRARIAEGLTQEEVARTLGVFRQEVARYERDERLPTLDRLIDMCVMYGVSSDSILGLAECPECRRTRESKEARSHCRGKHAA